MANAIYPAFKQALLDAATNADMNVNTVKVMLLNIGTYTYSSTHDFLNDVTGSVGTAQIITTPTVTSGTFDGDNVTFTAVAGTTSVGALGIFIDTANSTTSRLVAYMDSNITGLPFTTNGGDVTITWNASGIFAL